MKKVCIVEDDLGISSSLRLYLENSDFEVITFDTGGGASEFILENTPDLAILDINLPDKDGMLVCREVRKQSNLPIIMLTARDSEMDKVTGLESGADDYISKPFSPRELLARINSLLRRSVELSKPVGNNLEYENISIDTQKNQVLVDGVVTALTKNEYDILEKIWKEQGVMVTRETLMTEVIGYDNYMYDRTIDTHIKNIRKKLGNKDMILTIRGKGYRLNV